MGDFVQLGKVSKNGLYTNEIIWGEPVYAEIKSISQSEFYQAKGAGLKAEIKFILYESEYDHETKLLYNDMQYEVIRVYRKGLDKIELTSARCD